MKHWPHNKALKSFQIGGSLLELSFNLSTGRWNVSLRHFTLWIIFDCLKCLLFVR